MSKQLPIKYPVQGEHLLKLRSKKRHNGKKLSQEKIAELLDCSTKTYRSWEQGITSPDTIYLKRLQKLYDGVSTDYLLGLIEEKNHDIKFVCDYTGLSEEAVDALTTLPDNATFSHPITSAYLSPLLENPQFIDLLRLIDSIRYYTGHIGSALVEISPYLSEESKDEDFYSNIELIGDYSEALRLLVFEASEQWSDLIDSETDYKQILAAAREINLKYGE